MNPDHATQHEQLAEWDAAYVLGSLSPADRRRFEAHLPECDRCRAAVAELTGMPGLLARLSTEQAMALLTEPEDDRTGETEPEHGPRSDLIDLVEAEAVRRDRHRRRRRVTAWLSAAAAVIAMAIAIPVTITRADRPDETLVLDRVVATSPLTATIGLSSVGWGTKIDVECAYQSADPDVDPTREWSYSLWVISRDGRSAEVSSWNARNGWEIELATGTAIRLEQIAAVEIRSRDTGRVLLRKTIP